jgi:hypothetical protein
MPSPVRDNPARSRFELDADGVTAFMNYRLAGKVISLDHTETPVAARDAMNPPQAAADQSACMPFFAPRPSAP